MPINLVEEILHPGSIAVVGATRTGAWGGGGFVAALLEFGFKGKIYPVNPKYPEIQGLKSYPTLGSIPEPVDYVISSVPAQAVPEMLKDARDRGTKAVHLFTARLSETGRADAIELEQQIRDLAAEYGLRILGPNCMGIYYPVGGMAFHADFTKIPGAAGFISQSGMLARELVIASPKRGVYFSKVFSYGNALDLNECDFLEYLAQDPETRVIMMYIEGVKDGQRFFNTLRKTAAIKPVIILKGGTAEAGARATSSHTASMAGAFTIWKAAIKQAGAILADSFEELIDFAAAFYFLPPVRGYRVGVVGGTGGFSVLAADKCEQAGLDVIPLPQEIREELKNMGISIWDWLSNPVDLSIREDERLNVGNMLEIMARNPNFDLFITPIGGPQGPPRTGQPVPTEEYLLQQYRLEAFRNKPLLAVVSDSNPGVKELEARDVKANAEFRTALSNLKIPYYPTIGRAALAARKMVDYYRRRGPE
jgi:acetate---CoA ligase (ADP-forming)